MMSENQDLHGVREKSTPEQKTFDGIPFPLVLDASGSLPDVAAAADWVRHHKGAVEDRLLKHGAILFRGFPLKDAPDFDSFVKAFEYSHLPYVGGAAPRNLVVGDVYTANEAPSEAEIPFHHEMAQVPIYPSKLFFYCEVPPSKGGQTPLAPSTLIYELMASRHPEFVAKLERHGVRYTRILPETDDNTSSIGRGWKSTFLTEDRTSAEQKCMEHGTSYEWLPDGGLRTVTAVMPAVKVDERTGKKVWFNSIIAAYRGWNDARNDSKKAVTFANGDVMPEDIMESLHEIFEETLVAATWQQGDVIMVDNNQVLHARRPFTPPRRILACMIR